MRRSWPVVRLGKVLKRTAETVTISPDVAYREITVRLWGKGVILRGIISGAEIAGNRRFVAKPGQFILSRIDARNGAIGIVPAQLDGAVVTNDFPLFELERGKLDATFLGWLSKTSDFVELCKRASEGTTNRVRLQEEQFLSVEIPLPSLPEQRRIVARIEELAVKITEARSLRQEAVEEAEALLASRSTELLDGLRKASVVPIRTLGQNGSNPIQIGPFGAQLHRSEFVEDGVPVLNVGNVWATGLQLKNVDHVTPEKAVQLKRYTIQHDDLLFVRSGATLGKVCMVPKTCDGWLMTGHLFRVRFDEECCDPRFAFMCLRDVRGIREQVFGQVRGATRPGFNTTLLGNVELPLPPLSEQRCIVTYLDRLQTKIDALKHLQTETAAELDALLPAVLDKAFKGGL
jgi:type I restriction enzyme, S subunit